MWPNSGGGRANRDSTASTPVVRPALGSATGCGAGDRGDQTARAGPLPLPWRRAVRAVSPSTKRSLECGVPECFTTATCGFATQQVLDAIHVLLNVSGSGSFAEDNAMQQHWRDANVAARHAGLNAAVGLEVFGKSLLGVPEKIAELV